MDRHSSMIIEIDGEPDIQALLNFVTIRFCDILDSVTVLPIYNVLL